MSKVTVKNMQGVSAHLEYIKPPKDTNKYQRSYYDLHYNTTGIRPQHTTSKYSQIVDTIPDKVSKITKENPRKNPYEVPRNKEMHLKINSKVYHKKYGEGILKEICKKVSEAYIIVDFNGSFKTFSLKNITENELLKPYKFNFDK